jgi:hypothetical protein
LKNWTLVCNITFKLPSACASREGYTKALFNALAKNAIVVEAVKAGFNTPFLINVQIQSDEQEIASNSILMTKPSKEAVAGKDNHLVSKMARFL